MNATTKSLDLEGCLNLFMSKTDTVHTDDRKVLIEFKNSHLNYLNLGAHGNVIPNYDKLATARDCIDQFIKRNV
jgi:hypothetical protein